MLKFSRKGTTFFPYMQARAQFFNKLLLFFIDCPSNCKFVPSNNKKNSALHTRDRWGKGSFPHDSRRTQESPHRRREVEIGINPLEKHPIVE